MMIVMDAEFAGPQPFLMQALHILLSPTPGFRRARGKQLWFVHPIVIWPWRITCLSKELGDISVSRISFSD